MKWTRIARTGLHTAMSGQQVQLTEADLDKVVTSYNPKDHEAPLVLGHPTNNGPAYGWVQGLKRDGEYLLAQFAQIPDSLKKAVDNGHYKKVSMSLYPDGTLRHVGLLGATPPAIKGLGNINLWDADEATELQFNFSELANPMENAMDDRVKALEAEVARLKVERAEAQKAKTESEKALETAIEEKKKATKAKEEAEKSFAEAQAAKAKEARTAKVDALIKDGKVLPTEKDRVLAFAERLGGKADDDICFSEGEGKKPVEDHFFSWLESRQSHGLFEFAAPDNQGKGEAPVNTSSLAAKF